jgi:DNA polymerase III epsilon subunit family exonuclease
MAPFPNLISEALLITDTIAFLVRSGGRAPAVNVVNKVMRIRKPEPAMAKMLVLDLIDRDPRLALEDDIVSLNDRTIDNNALDETGFVVIDLETTGAKAPPCRVTEIGAYRIKNGAIAGEFHTLVNPEMPIPSFITMLTGISDRMVADAPKFSEVAGDLLDFIGDNVIIAHNARFDLGFLNYEIARLYGDYRLANPSICTVQLSRRLLPGIENHKLGTVARYFAIELVNHHRASDDARATAQIFINFLEEMKEIGITDVGTAKRFSVAKMRYDRRKAIAP